MSRVEKPFDNLIFGKLILVKIFNSLNNSNAKVALVSVVVGFCKYFNYAFPHRNPPSTVVQSK